MTVNMNYTGKILTKALHTIPTLFYKVFVKFGNACNEGNLLYLFYLS